MGPSGGIVLSFVLLLIRGCLSATRHDDICGDYNGRKLYLELGHRGFLSARDVAPDVSPKGGTPTNLTSAHHQCGMELVTCPSCVITVIFHFLNMSTCTQDGSCRCDYLWITEPPYEASGAPFCGYVKSPPTGAGDIGQAEYFGAFPRGYHENSAVGYRSRTRTLALALLFASPHRHAFTLEYSSERNRQFLKGYRSSITSNATSGGFLTSPFFPAPYPRDLGAEHVITSPDSNVRVRLLFSDFQLAGSSIIEFYDWNGQRLEVSSGAQFRPPVVLSSGPSLLVRFYANGGTGLGYKATYSFLTGRIPENVMKPVTDCGGFVENIGGAITMMGMVPPGSVRAYDCVWIVRPPKFRAHLKTHLYLRVAQFQDMGGSTELHVRQGTTSETPLLEVLRLPSPSATSPLRHHSLSSRYRRHAPLTNDLTQRRASRLFGWLQRPYTTEMELSETTAVAMSLATEDEVSKDTEPSFRIRTNTAEVPPEAVVQWATTLPTTGAPSSPQALVGSPVTDSPRSPPPRRRRPPPPVAARKQVGREHVLPLEVGFYVSLSGTFAHDSRLSIVFTAFSYMDCFTGTDFLCKNHRCIPGALTCDGFDHCGDASDEPPSCLTDNGDGSGPMEGGGGMGMMGGMGGDAGIDRHWYSHTPNYYFPKMERYPDLKTATLVFIVSSLGLIILIAALIILLYRMGSRARQHRELQSRLQTISDLLGEYDGARIEEISTDDPPDYEAPPTYEDVVKAGPTGDSTSTSAMVPLAEEDCALEDKESIDDGRRRARPRPGSTATSSSGFQDDTPDSSLPPPDISTLIPPPPPPHTSSRSCQTTPIPDSPPPTYETALLRASHSLQANILQSTSTPLFPSLSSGPQSGFNSPPSTAPNSLPYMPTVLEGPERYLSASETEDGHSIMTDASILDGGEMEQQTEALTTAESEESENVNLEEGISEENSGRPQEVRGEDGREEVGGESGSSNTREEEATGEEEARGKEAGKAKSERVEGSPEGACSSQIGGSGVDAESDTAGKSEGSSEAPEVARGAEMEAGKQRGEGDKGEARIDKDLPVRMPDSISAESSSVADKDESPQEAEEETVGKCEASPPTDGEASNEKKEDSGTREEEGDGAESEEECSERQKLIDKSKEEVVEEKEVRFGSEEDGKEDVAGEEAGGGCEGEGKKGGDTKEGNERDRKAGKASRDKEEAHGVLKEDEEWECSSGSGGENKSSSEQKEPHPHEIVGGLVKGHIKLFQSMSSSKDEDDGESRVVRRRVAMRGWRSVDVGCGERLLED